MQAGVLSRVAGRSRHHHDSWTPGRQVDRFLSTRACCKLFAADLGTVGGRYGVCQVPPFNNLSRVPGSWSWQVDWHISGRSGGNGTLESSRQVGRTGTEAKQTFGRSTLEGFAEKQLLMDG